MDKSTARRISVCRKVPVKSTHPRCHWTRKKGMWKVKKCWQTIGEAEEYIRKHRLTKYSAYVCKVCGQIHIGYCKEDD